MQWLNPSGAWAFLMLLPIIALYLLRRRAKHTPVPSLLLWKQAQNRTQQARPFHRLRPQMLLWLQILAAILLALALMRPTTVGGLQGECVLIFDLSASMQCENENGETRLDAARRQAVALLEGMNQNAVTVLAAGHDLEQKLVRSTDEAAIYAAIERLNAQNGGDTVAQAISLAVAMRQEAPALAIYVFSDTADAPEGVNLIAVGERVPNRAVAGLTLSEQNGAMVAFARARNTGDQTEATMECYADGVLCDVRTVQLPANAETSVRFTVPEGTRSVEARFTNADACAFDDARFAVSTRPQTHTALLVTEQNVFLQRALALDDTLMVLLTSPQDIDQSQTYDLLVYDGVLPEALPETGAVLALQPTGEVLGISLGENAAQAGTLRQAPGMLAAELCEHLVWDNVSVRSFLPLTGGTPVALCGAETAIAISERAGRRAAVIGFDLHDSNLPLKADFPVLVQNLLGYLLPDTVAQIADAVCGEPITLPLNPRTEAAYVRTPSGKLVETSSGMLSDTNEMGIYHLQEQLYGGDVNETAFVLHAPIQESDTQAVSESQADTQTNENLTGRREWSILLLLLCFALLIVEWGVSRRGA